MYVGLLNFALRVGTSPLSFITLIIISKFLSRGPSGLTVFGAWQIVFTLVTGYFALPATLLTVLESRYAAEERPVGGIVMLNLILGVVSSLIYSLLVPFLMERGHYYQPVYFYSGVLMIMSYYVYLSISALALGRTPIQSAIGSAIFQIVRFIFAVILVVYLNSLVLGAVMAYSFGYIAQALYNISFLRGNLSLDFAIAWEALKRSVVFIVDFMQQVLESSVSLLAVALISLVPNSYFESAVVVANIATWPTSASAGLVRTLTKERNAEALESVLKVYFLSSGAALAIIWGEGYQVLSYLRPDYTQAMLASVILSIAFFLKGLFRIFYNSIVVLDETMSVGGSGYVKGITGRLLRSNVIISGVSMLVTSLVMYFFTVYHGLPQFYQVFTAVMVAPILANSVVMTILSMRTLKGKLNFVLPLEELLFSILSSIASGIVAVLLFHQDRPLQIIEGISVAIAVYITLEVAISPFARRVSKTLMGRVYSTTTLKSR